MAKRTRANFVPRRPTRFRETELARAVRAAKRAGGERVDVDLQSGRISVILAKSGEPQASGNDLDKWMEKRERDARQT